MTKDKIYKAFCSIGSEKTEIPQHKVPPEEINTMNNMNNQTTKKEENSKTAEICNLATALSKAQRTMTGAKKDKRNPFFKSTYADLASVFDAIREPFGSNGLSITQTMDVLSDGKAVLLTRLMHCSGEFIDSKMVLPQDNNPQKLGSALTYFRRYSLMAIAGIPAEDDDGNAAVPKKTQLSFITPKQVSDLECLINGYSDIRKMLLDNCSNNIESITVDRYPGAVAWIKEKIKERGK